MEPFSLPFVVIARSFASPQAALNEETLVGLESFNPEAVRR
jgi:hypothetical protein